MEVASEYAKYRKNEQAVYVVIMGILARLKTAESEYDKLYGYLERLESMHGKISYAAEVLYNLQLQLTNPELCAQKKAMGV